MIRTSVKPKPGNKNPKMSVYILPIIRATNAFTSLFLLFSVAKVRKLFPSGGNEECCSSSIKSIDNSNKMLLFLFQWSMKDGLYIVLISL